jgi:LemA protein
MRKQMASIGMLVMVALLVTGCGYNTLISKEEAVKKAWGDIDASLQRRADLIPNLVETVKGYAAHEKETLQAVIEARAKATQTQVSADDLGNVESMQKYVQAQSGLSSALARLMVVVERYPDLKANQNFLDLQNQLEGTENRINVARQRYNQAVLEFNSMARKLPYSITNNLLLHLKQKEYYKAEVGSEKAPQVKFK